MTHERLVQALVLSKNQAADDALLEALQLGEPNEQFIALQALFRRQTERGLVGLIEHYDDLDEPLRQAMLDNIGQLHHALAQAGRSERNNVRLAAMKLIALGHQGKLSYVLLENLREMDDGLSKAATEALVALARWISTETRRLQRGEVVAANPEAKRQSLAATHDTPAASPSCEAVYRDLLNQRPEIEEAVAKAIETARHRHGPDILRAALLLCDWPESKTLHILHTSKHGGQSLMVRRLQQPPASEHVEAFLLGASHGGLRSHFGITFSHIEEAPVLDALLRKTHWLKDANLQACMRLVTRGSWWSDPELVRDISRRDGADAARVGDWIAVSGIHEVAQDERLERLREHASHDFSARLRLLRVCASRRGNASSLLLRNFLTDPDERLMRMAVREIVRRRPADCENILLPLMTSSPLSVRRVVARAVGQAGFEQFWQRYDKLDRSTRKQAGNAMLKLLPDFAQRLSRRLAGGELLQRLKAMQMTQELHLAPILKEQLIAMCSESHPKLRSKAVSALGDVPDLAHDPLVERLLRDTDSRVRANAIEVLETKSKTAFIPMLVERARAGSNRERANAIKAMHRMRVGTFTQALAAMLGDVRPEHRISALWALKKTGCWAMIPNVGKLAKEDANIRVRRFALNVLQHVSDLVKEQKAKAAG